MGIFSWISGVRHDEWWNVFLGTEPAVHQSGNVRNVVMVLAGLGLIVAVGAGVVRFGGRLVERGWPLWTSGGVGAALSLVGYHLRISWATNAGVVLLAGSLAVALFVSMMDTPGPGATSGRK